MKNLKVLGLGLLTFVLCACSQKSAPAADVYFLLFVGHSTAAPAVEGDTSLERQFGLISFPKPYATAIECNDARNQVLLSLNTPQAKDWFSLHQVDKQSIICVPIKFQQN